MTAPYGHNATIVHNTLGTYHLRVARITQSTQIQTREDAARMAKTLYPLWVAQGSFQVVVEHRTTVERNRMNDWLRRYMTRAAGGELDQLYVDLSVPSRRFSRRGVVHGELEYGSDVRTAGQKKVTTLAFIGAADPQRRSQVSRMRTAPNDPAAAYFYPAGIQPGWDTTEQPYQHPPAPIRPGDPDRPV